MRDICVLSDGSAVIAPLVSSAGGDGFDGPADSIQVAPLYLRHQEQEVIALEVRGGVSLLNSAFCCPDVEAIPSLPSAP